jgi:hypothetical protein
MMVMIRLMMMGNDNDDGYDENDGEDENDDHE